MGDSRARIDPQDIPGRRFRLTRRRTASHPARTSRAKKIWPGLWAIIAGAITATVTATLTLWLQPVANPLMPPDLSPVQVITDVNDDPCQGAGWVVPKAYKAVKPAPGMGLDESWDRWLRREGAVPATGSEVYVQVQGRTSAEVTLTGLKIHLVRSPVITGTYVNGRCGDLGAYRWVEIDLDKNPPKQTSVFEKELMEDHGYVPSPERKPIKFPYKVTQEDAETFLLRVVTKNCTCTWTAEFTWLSEGKRGSTLVNDNGRPFKATGTKDVTGSCHRGSESPWECRPGNDIEE